MTRGRQEGGTSDVKPTVIFSHAVASFTRHSDVVVPPRAAHSALTPLGASDVPAAPGPAEVGERLAALRALLDKQRIPYTLEPRAGDASQATDTTIADAELVILGCLRAWPPYTARSCSCENDVVLRRFRELVSRVDALLSSRAAN